MSFSVLISCYRKDSPRQLAEALESFCVQTLPATEIVLVEDGPLTDELYTVIADYKDKLPLLSVPLNENRGLGGALNEGLLKCNHEIVLRMDADDICHPERFEKQITFLAANPDVDILGTWAKDIDGEGNVIGERTNPTTHEELYKIIWTNPVIHPAIAYRKSAILKIGSYDTKLKRRQDYDLWMRAAAEGLKFANLPEYLLYYRFTEDYYKKNNFKVALDQAHMGVKGLKRMNGPLYAYFLVYGPVIRSLFPKFMIGFVHKLFNKFDPRKRRV